LTDHFFETVTILDVNRGVYYCYSYYYITLHYITLHEIRLVYANLQYKKYNSALLGPL